MNKDTLDTPELEGATISVVIHATEDKEKVTYKIAKIFSLNSDKFEEISTKGHWGNQIIMLNLRLGRGDAGRTIKTIFASLDNTSKTYLLSSLENSTDERDNLYVRVDKQRVCRDEISLSDQDSIKIRFRPLRTFKQSNKSKTYRELLSSEL